MSGFWLSDSPTRQRCWVLGFFLLLTALPLFSFGGMQAGAKTLSVVQTRYFDIIFPPESAGAAHKIIAVADDYYEEITARLQTDFRPRFPVTIGHSTESLNGYFIVAPYNRITLIDTPPENSLDMNTDMLLSVFYHELTHAVTVNMRSPFARFVSGVFGDWFAPAGFLETNLMIEGSAVFFESLHGEGRVNDPYSRQLVQQAKLDDRFPSWRDVTGARDTFPGGTDAYAFGALFSQFLFETYGMEAYANFWKTTGSLHGFKRSLKKVYGKSVAVLWKDFESWVPVPSATAAISPDQGTEDFFVASGISPVKKSGFAKENARRSVFRCIDTAQNGVVWNDQKTGGIWYAPISGGTIGTPKKLFVCSGVLRVSLSDDGEWIAVSYLHEKQQLKTAVCVYHLRSGRLVSLPADSVRDAGFVRETDGTLLLSCVNIAHDTISLDFYTISQHKKELTLFKTISFARGELPFNPVAAQDGGFACIVKKGMDWTIRLYENDTRYREYGGHKTILHNLHRMLMADGRLAFSFSYATQGSTATFSRAGLLYVQPKDFASELVLQNDDVSGSVLDAAVLPAGQGERLLYVAALYDTHTLMQMDVSRRTVIRHKGRAPAPTVSRVQHDGDLTAPQDETAIAGSAYHPLRYYRHGMLLPVGMAKAYDRDALDEYTFGYAHVGTAFVGATIGSSNPWGDNIVALSGGWNPFDKNGGVYLDYSGGTDTFSYDFNGNALFDSAGFMQTTTGVSLSNVLYRRFGKSVTAGASGVYFYGHDERGGENDWAGRSRASVQFSTVHKHSPRYADYAGVYVQPFVFAERVSEPVVNAGATVGARIPGWLPLSFSATLFPSATYAAAGTASAVLFSHEIQRGIPIALYADRIYLSAAYTGRFSYQADAYFDVLRTARIVKALSRADYSDSLQLKLGAVSSVNAGVLVRLGFDIGVVLEYRPHPKPNQSDFALGVATSLVY